MAVRRVRSRRTEGGEDVQPDRHCQDERRRSAGLARRRAGAHRRSPRLAPAPTPAMALVAPGRGPYPGGMTATSIAHLRIKLNDLEPTVVRRVEVPLTIRLDRLHLVLQAAMGWMNSHLYEIRARDVGWGRPDPDFGDGPLDASKARLVDVLEDVGARSLKYLYDFGDGWEHSVRIERITDAMPGIAYPRLIEAAGRCPLEDVGGPWGYREFLDAITDPNHREH